MRITNEKHTVTIKSKKLRTKKYAYNENICEVIFSSTTKVIGNSAFYDCLNLKNVTLPSSLKVIEDDAFSLCKSLSRIALPMATEQIGERCFSWSGIEKIVLPESITEIRNSTFSNCRKLKSIKISKACTRLGDDAFLNCMDLDEIAVPEAVTSLGKNCFKGCSSLKTVTLPDNIKILPENTFENCRSLETVLLPQKLEFIGAECFAGCVNLKNIVLPDSVKYIGEKAFYRCEGLASIKLPKGLTHIDNQVFSNCSNLKSLQFENDLDYAGAAILPECNAILPERILKMHITSFLKKSEYRLCPTINIPESVNELSLGFEGLIPYSFLIKNKSCFNHIMAIEKYGAKVFVSENYYNAKEKIIQDGYFDFNKYDSLFETAQAFEKPVIAAFRLAYPVELSENNRLIYQTELFKRARDAVLFAIKSNEGALLKYLIDNVDFDTDFCEEMYMYVSKLGLPNLLQILTTKRNNTGLNEINSLFEELML